MFIGKNILLLFALVMPFSAGAVSDGGEGTPIIIYETETPQHSTPPRAPATLPIECTVFPSLLFVETIFYYDLGFISVELENHATGEYNQITVNAQSGSILIPFSGTEGSWIITFTLSNGSCYYGEYEIE